MLPGIGGGEIVVIALVAILVVGPKDLPKLLRFIGQMVAKLRAATAEFRNSFDDIAKETEFDGLRAELAALRAASPLANLSNPMRLLESGLHLDSAVAAEVPVEPALVRGVVLPSASPVRLAMLNKPADTAISAELALPIQSTPQPTTAPFEVIVS